MVETRFDNMVHYTVNFYGTEDEVALCRRFLASCGSDGSYSMFSAGRLVPLPDGVEKGSLEAKAFYALNYGCSEFFNVREDGLNTLYFDNGSYLMEPLVFEKIVERFPGVKLAVVEGMDSEFGRGATVTRYECVDGVAVSDVLYTAPSVDVPPIELGNRDVREASYLKHLAAGSLYGVFLDPGECLGCGLRDGALMRPDGSIDGVCKDDEVEFSFEPSFVRSRVRDGILM